MSSGAKTALTAGKGKLTLIETMKAGYGQGSDAAPAKDWAQARFGPMTPASSIELREKALESVLEAMGVPSSLHRSDGAALRESYRHFFTATIEPLGKLISEELSDKLEVDFEFLFPQASKSDIVGSVAGLQVAGRCQDTAEGRCSDRWSAD